MAARGFRAARPGVACGLDGDGRTIGRRPRLELSSCNGRRWLQWQSRARQPARGKGTTAARQAGPDQHGTPRAATGARLCPDARHIRWRRIDRPRRLAEFSATHAKLQGATPVEILVLQPLVALIAGILILIVPRLLNYIVAIYLILIGLVGLFGHFGGTAG
jgi:hypothetical protein